MALTSDEQELFDLGRRALPEWYSADARANEFLGAAAKIFGSARVIAERWLRELTLLTLAGADVDEPDWLDQHARDRGTSRQLDESDDALVQRLRTTEDVLTRPALLAAVQAMMTAAGVAGTAVMVELPRDRAHFGSYSSFGGAGGFALVKSGTDVLMTPAVSPAAQFARPPYSRRPDALSVYKITLAGCTNAGNDGTFTTTGLVGNAVKFANAAGVSETAPGGASWSVKRYDVDGNLRDGFKRAYLGRGYRMGHSPPSSFIVILPYPTSAAFAASVLEMLRLKKAGGVKATVERRLVP